jgi:putative toxin-antitoxin system antitoxin component (TIGR02293 family)
MKSYKSTRKKYVQLADTVQILEDKAYSEYQKTSNPYAAVAALLGFKNIINSELGLIEATRNGISKNSLIKLATLLGLNQEELCNILHISTKTFQRFTEYQKLDIYTTEQAIEMALIYYKAIQLFNTNLAVQQWIKTPLMALNGQTPLSLLDTGIGANLVLNTLGRLEEGVFS